MKTRLLTLSILLTLFASAALAQGDKGSYYLGGSLFVSHDGRAGTTTRYSFQTGYTDYTVDNLTNIQLSPEFGYFLSKKWSIGIQPIYSRSAGTETSAFYSYTTPANNYVSSDTYHIDVVGLAINVRYYYMLTDRIGIFPQFSLSSENNIKDFGNGELTLAASPNIVFFATKKLGVNLGFGNITYATDYHFNHSYFNMGFNNSIAFGLNYYFGGK